MATYKMLKTQRGVRKGDVHPVVFLAEHTYEIDDDLAGQFETLEAVEPSTGEASEPQPVADDNADIHENWLDTDPAVLRHGELTAAEVVAKDESDNPQTSLPAEQEEGKAEGEEPAAKQGEAKSSGDAPENKSKKSK